MALSDDSSITQLLNEVKDLFKTQAPSTSVAQEGSLNTSPVDGGYQSPIKGSWYNSGSFDASGALRPNGRRGHAGVDMRAQAGTPLYPMAPGIVTSVGSDPLGGNVVNVQHANGVRTYYAHLSTAKVQKGDKVGYDTILGTVGDTGNAKGTVPHCHFQVWTNNNLQDPAKFFSVPKYTNVSVEEKNKGLWVSDKAKQEAAAFNMQSHVQQNRQSRRAFSSDVDRLMKVAYQFCKLASG